MFSVFAGIRESVIGVPPVFVVILLFPVPLCAVFYFFPDIVVVPRVASWATIPVTSVHYIQCYAIL